MKTIDILLPIYNEPLEYIKKSIESILNQTYTKFKLIIILDSPTNFSAIKYVDELKTKDQRIVVIKNEKNLGLVTSLNKGIAYCTDEYVARMDADDISNPNRLEKQIQYLEENNLDFIGANAIGFSKNDILYKTNLPVDDILIKKKLKYGNCFYHSTFFFKTEILEKIHYEQALYCEDYLFTLRVNANNYKMGNHPEYLLNYRVNLNSISNSHSVEQYVYANYLRNLYKKNKNIDFSKFQKYILSSNCKKRINKVGKFFNLKDKYKTENNKLKKIFIFIKMFFVSPNDFWFLSISKFMFNTRVSENDSL